jgi:hypothetical protein
MKSMTQAAAKNVVNAARSTRRTRMAISASFLKSFARLRVLAPPIRRILQTFIKCIGSIF